MKIYTILPIVAIFLIAMSVGDKLWTLPYLLKTIPAFAFIAISAIMIIKNLRSKKKIE